MKKDFLVFLAIFFLTILFYRDSLTNFFTQDDFILINYFSQNDLVTDIKHVFGAPAVTHFRPFHNLYFFIAGNLFGKSYWGYHLMTILLHASGGFVVYKIFKKIFKGHKFAFWAGSFYAVHPAHFTSLFWISGGATVIGLLLLSLSFYSYVSRKKNISLILYMAAIGASEAMLAGLILFIAYEILVKKSTLEKKFLAELAIISVGFAILRLSLTSQAAFSVYNLEFSAESSGAVKYYLLRILGFAEASGDLWISLLLLMWLLIMVITLAKLWQTRVYLKEITFLILMIFAGLFPFIFLPFHLSPHYMNISIFGFSILAAVTVNRLKGVAGFVFAIIFLLTAFYNIEITKDNSWVVKRSVLSKTYLAGIEKGNPKSGSSVIFRDSLISSSREAYIVLGGGEAIKFWFPEKNYKVCFSTFENCQPFP